MTSDARETEIHQLLERHDVKYEVRPYYEVLLLNPVGAPPIDKKVQAGFDVNLYGRLETEHFPLYSSEGAHKAVRYFEELAHDIESNIGQHCTVQVIPDDSLVLDTRHNLRPEAMLTIRIAHCRGMGQPEGPAEEQALTEVTAKLKELGIRRE
jgi:hypothetical protein